MTEGQHRMIELLYGHHGKMGNWGLCLPPETNIVEKMTRQSETE